MTDLLKNTAEELDKAWEYSISEITTYIDDLKSSEKSARDLIKEFLDAFDGYRYCSGTLEERKAAWIRLGEAIDKARTATNGV